MDTIKKNFEDKSAKTLEVLKEELNGVRAGRANPAILDKISIDYYGTMTPLKSVANISVPDPKTIMISPFDPKSVPDIEKAINTSDIGIHPSNDGKVIRLVIPQMTEERRTELTKVIKAMGEECKVAIRNLRRDANDHIKKLEKTGDLTEDDVKDGLEDIQKSVDSHIKDIDKLIAEKHDELMEV